MENIELVNEKTPLLDLHPLMAIRTMNVLSRAGYKTVGDILSLTEDDVMKCRNAGRRTVMDAMRFISEYKECHGYTQSETLISPSGLIEYCQNNQQKCNFCSRCGQRIDWQTVESGTQPQREVSE